MIFVEDISIKWAFIPKSFERVVFIRIFLKYLAKIKFK